jgi:hypothetical protein
MRVGIVRTGLAGGLLVLMGLTGASSAAAVTAPMPAPVAPATDDQLIAAVDRMNTTGYLSDADRALILTRPDIASVFVDPDSAEVVGGKGDGPDIYPAPVSGADQVAAYATRSRGVDRYINYYSLTGAKTAEYHFTVNWQYNGSKVVGTPGYSHYLRTFSTPYLYDRGFTSTDRYANLPGPYAWTITLQARYEQCVPKIGCWSLHNPWAKFGVYKDGTYHYTPRK